MFPLDVLAKAALAQHLGPADLAQPQAQLLRESLSHLESAQLGLKEAVRLSLEQPLPEDHSLVALAVGLYLRPPEILSVALAACIEEDPRASHAIAFLQTPGSGAQRPSLGLCAQSFASITPPGVHPIHGLISGPAAQVGLLVRSGEDLPLSNQSLSIPTPAFLALRGHDPVLPGASIGLSPTLDLILPASTLEQAERHARALEATAFGGLCIRGNADAETRAVASMIAHAMGKRPIFIEGERPPVLTPIVMLRNLLPVFCLELGPGERKALPLLPLYSGPIIVCCGMEGQVEYAQGRMLSWPLTVPSVEERIVLWKHVLSDDPLCEKLAKTHRHRPARIADLGKLSRRHALIEGREELKAEDIEFALWAGESQSLGALAQPLFERIEDDALVFSETVSSELSALLARCNARDGLAENLGPSAKTRYRPGIKALFVGPSGTGKTLGAGWLATRLGMPLFRVDLANITSKYIGETEKNLAQLFARAEHEDVALLFDEADSMFGKRTEIKEANDRFANAQTNYLLQRVEQYDGLVILTSNSKARFDPAFLRRLDVIIEFPLPSPEERRALWIAHLGKQHKLSTKELNRLAVAADLCGGHIRNVVLAAAVFARSEERAMGWPDIVKALGAEYKKLGRTLPSDLRGNG